ncbi:MAG: MATE family efflux transporter [Deltaproteobacteria bacterium]|jgi:putative MATE family efflux protein|nr:MATE family efflux transporter [Deltaproteobacteria bacterium]
MRNETDNARYWLEKAPVPQAIRHMAVPMILGMAVNMLYNITDAWFIGLLDSTAALAAVTLALPFTTILMALGELFGVGGGTRIARLLGENDLDGVKKTSSVSLYLSLLTGLVFACLCLPFLGHIVKVLGASGETFAATQDYILPFVLGAPFVTANFTLGQTVRSEGAAKESMTGMVIGVVVNILLDPVFIFPLGMGVMGAAIATVIGNACGVAYYLWHLGRKSPVQSVSMKDFQPARDMLGNIFKIGVSAFLLSCFLVVSGLLFNNYAMIYGEHVAAAFGVANRVCQIVDFIGMGLYMGVVPLIAFAYAAGNAERLGGILRTTAGWLVGVVLGLAAILFVLRAQVIGLFSSDPEVLAVGETILTALLASTLFAGLAGLCASMFQAFGKGVQSNVMSVARGLALFPVIIAGNALFGLDGVIWSMTAAELCACATGACLWLLSKRRIMDTPAEERRAAPDAA